MHRIWQEFDPRLIVMATVGGLFALALFIHICLLLTPKYDWILRENPKVAVDPAAHLAPSQKLFNDK